MTYSLKVGTEMFQILDEQGEAKEEVLAELNLEKNTYLKMYEWMIKGRVFDRKFLNLQRQGRIGTYGSFQGQEAAQVGNAFALTDDDWVVPSYRETLVSLIRGMEIKDYLKVYRGIIGVLNESKVKNQFPNQIIIAGQIPHAVGFAWASKLKKERSVTVCYFGDGATSQGDFHEGLNFAAVFKVPVVFYCQNNQWAISVPIEKQTASETISQKAIAYGMKGIRVDGNDVLACYKVTKDAIERARLGEGPCLIEAVTYRQGSHTTADDWTKYRSKEEVEEWSTRKDPVIRFEKFLQKRGLWSAEIKEEMISRFEAEIEEALTEFDLLKPTPPYEIFDYVYDQPHPQLLMQKNELKNRVDSIRGN